jgi:hypothetical protein
MTEISYNECTLDELIARANCILLVKPIEPFISFYDIPIHPDTHTYPPHRERHQHFVVIKSLIGELTPGTPVDVLDANSEQALELHRDYYLKDMRKSPLYQHYTPDTPPADKAPRFIFLRHLQDGRYEFAMHGAEEAESMAATITRVLPCTIASS